MREIESARLRLRTWREADLAPYARICADPEVMRYLSGPMTCEHSEQQVSEFVRHWEERGVGLWTVEEKSSGAFIGFIGLLYHEDWSEGKHRTEVGWRPARPFWGRGRNRACRPATAWTAQTPTCGSCSAPKGRP